MKTLRFLGTGYRHYCDRRACEDRIGVRHGGASVLAVADGCSASPFAADAAEANVNAVLSFFENADDAFLCRTAAAPEDLTAALKNELLAAARKRGYDSAADFSATLVFCVIAQKYLLVGGVGDSRAAVFGEKGETLYFLAPEQSRKTETHFTNGTDLAGRLRFSLLDRSFIRCAALYSDGPADSFEENGRPRLERTVLSVINGKTATEEDLAALLTDPVDRAAAFADDWSAVFCDLAAESGSENEEEILPVPLPRLFLSKLAKQEGEAGEYAREQLAGFDRLYADGKAEKDIPREEEQPVIPAKESVPHEEEQPMIPAEETAPNEEEQPVIPAEETVPHEEEQPVITVPPAPFQQEEAAPLFLLTSEDDDPSDFCDLNDLT